MQRNTALQNIREAFNPFEIKAPSRISKHDVTTVKTMKGEHGKAVLGRPGVTKSKGEEVRRQTLLVEMQRRNKAGNLVDKRIGEGDPTLAPEEKAQRRLEREISGWGKDRSVFDLEDSEGEEDLLTHGGRALLGLGGEEESDDFEVGSLEGSSEDEDGERRKKRRRDGRSDAEQREEEEEQPKRKKTKAEAMEEVIAKSKLHKYERQKAKEQDDALREELDKGLGDLKAFLFAFKQPTAPDSNVSAATAVMNDVYMNPARAALISGAAGLDSDKDYDRRLRELTQERRSKPADRTKTDEEKAKEQTERLQLLEEQRLRRMKGEEDDEDEQADKDVNQVNAFEPFSQIAEQDDAAEFGFKNRQVLERPPGFEDDEDEFIIDDEFGVSGSDLDDAIDAGSEAELPDEILALANGHRTAGSEEEEDSEEEEADLRPAPSDSSSTCSCPRSLEELNALLKDKAFEEVPKVVRQIRASHDPAQAAGNKEKLADFSQALVSYIAQTSSSKPPPPLAVTETLIKHIHSLSRTFPTEIARAFRTHLEAMHKSQSMNTGDIAILTAIGTIYPTSDHFHQVVTPAITIMARWLGLTTPKDAKDLYIGAYLVALTLKYQSLSKRYIPEVVRFTLLALRSKQPPPLLKLHIANLRAMADLWAYQSAFIEIFTPSAVKALHQVKAIKELRHITILLEQARLRRRPLLLHNHRLLPIKTAIPKFEEGFDPDKRYDPDVERAEATKLRKQYKKERKGALRELRKDASFLAREQLKEKKEKDRAYEEKYRKLVASVQAEEGAESKKYEKEKRMRKARR